MIDVTCYSEDIEEEKRDKLQLLKEYAENVLSLDAHIDELNENLSLLKEKRESILVNKAPVLFEELNIESIKLNNGQEFSIKLIYSPTILKEKDFLQFLSENNYAISKKMFSASFGKGEEETKLVTKLIDKLKEAELLDRASIKETIHASTLKAWVKEIDEILEDPNEKNELQKLEEQGIVKSGKFTRATLSKPKK